MHVLCHAVPDMAIDSIKMRYEEHFGHKFDEGLFPKNEGENLLCAIQKFPHLFKQYAHEVDGQTVYCMGACLPIFTTLSLIGLLFATMSLCGCITTTSPETIKVQPQLEVNASKMGNNLPVAVVVINTLPITGVIGARMNFDHSNPPITVDSDITQHVQTATEKALKKIGFDPVTEGASRKLLINIKSLDYQVKPTKDTHLLKKHVPIEISCTLIVTVQSANQTLYRQYHSTLTDTPESTPSTTTDSQMINQVVSATLNKMINDPKITQLLAQ